jgi:hypothetical protein
VKHTDLTAEQYAPIIAKLTEQRDYLHKLRERMNACGFAPSDPLNVAIIAAWQHASNACVVACTCRNRLAGVVGVASGGAASDAAVPRRPWAGDHG